MDNLCLIVDSNGFQNDGAINEKMTFDHLKSKWSGFGWNMISCDGHNIEELLDAFSKRATNKPTVIVAKTTKGKGISFMENNNDWHHGRLTEKLYEEAIKELK